MTQLLGQGVMELTAEATQFFSTLAQAQAAAVKYERAVVQSAGQANAALAGIGAGAKDGAAATEAAATRATAALQRQVAQTVLTKTEFLAFTAAAKGLPEQVYGPLIAAVAKKEAADKAAAAAAREAAVLARAQAAEAARLAAAQRSAALEAERYANKLGLVGVTAKQTESALRQLPAQFTDIFTSLAAGQNPLLVFLQQGGQIKDQFGGLGNAAKALVAAINPTTLALLGVGAAVGIIGYGLVKGAAELTAYNRALILSGNAAGATTAQLRGMAEAIAATGNGTQGKAAEVLAEMAASGRVGAENLQRFTAAAIQLERVGGDAASKTVEAFAELGKKPLEAALKLNETTNFLTRSTYEQIKALEEQGRTQEAARVAQEAYSSAIESRAPQIVARLGTIETAWRNIKDVAKDAADALLELGRDPTLRDRAETLQRQINVALSERNFTEPRPGTPSAERLNALREQLAVVRQLIAAENEGAKGDAERKESMDARIAANKTVEAQLTKEQKLGRDVLAFLNQARKGKLEELEIQRTISAMVEKTIGAQKAAASSSGGRSAYAQLAEDIDKARLAAEADAEAGGKMSEARRLQIDLTNRFMAATERMTLVQRVATAQEIERAVAARAAVEADKAALAASTARGRAILEYAAQQTAAENEIQESIDAQRRAGEQALKSVQDRIEAVENENRAAVLAASANISLAEAVERVTIARLAEKRAQLVNDPAALDALNKEIAAREKLLTVIASGEARKANDKAADDAARAWERTNEQITRSLADALMKGGKSGWDYIKGYVRSQVLTPVVQMFAQPVASFLQQLVGVGGASGGFGGAAGGGAGATSYINALSSARTLWQGVTGGFASIGTGVSNAYGTAYANATGTGIDGLLATNNAYGTAGGAGGTGTAIGTVAQSAAGVAAGVYGGRAISGGYAISGSGNAYVNAGTAIGEAIGLYFGVPGVGGAIGGAIGGALNRVFGRKAPEVESRAIEGFFGAAGDFSGSAVANIVEKGGLFRSDKRYQEIVGITGDLDKALDEGGKKIADLAKVYGEALGLPVARLAEVTQTVKVDITDSAEDNAKAIESALKQYADALLGVFAPDLEPLRKSGETISQVIERVGGTINTVNALFKDLGLTLLEASVAGGGAAVSLAEMFGGLDNLVSASGAYYENFYSQAERAAKSTERITETLAGVGVVMPATREAFRDIVEAQDLTTESGRKTFATLLGVSSAFAELTPLVDLAAEAAEAAAEAQRKALEVAREREGLENQLLRLQGDTAELRRRELAALDPSNRALQERIYALEDEAAAAEDATAAAQAASQAIANAREAAAKTIADIASAAQRIAAADQGVFDALRAISDYRQGLVDAIEQTAAEIADVRARAVANLDAAKDRVSSALRAIASAAEDAADRVGAAEAAIAAARTERVNAATGIAALLAQQQGNIGAGRDAVIAALIGLRDTAAGAQGGVDSARQRITDAFLSAQDRATAAQTRLAELQGRAVESTDRLADRMAQLSASLTDYLNELNISAAPAGQRPDVARALFLDAASRAQAGDADAAGRLLGLARAFRESSAAGRSTGAQFDADDREIRSTLSRVNAIAATLGASANATNTTADNSAALARAQAEVAAALAEVERIRGIAAEAGASLTANSVDLLAEWRSAQEAATAAVSAYTAATAQAAALGVSIPAEVGQFATSLASLSAAQAALEASMLRIAAAGVDLALADQSDELQRLIDAYASAEAGITTAAGEHAAAVTANAEAATALATATTQAAAAGVTLASETASIASLVTAFGAALTGLADAESIAESIGAVAIESGDLVAEYEALTGKAFALGESLATLDAAVSGIDFSPLDVLDPLGDLLTQYAEAVRVLNAAQSSASTLGPAGVWQDVGGGFQRLRTASGAVAFGRAGEYDFSVAGIDGRTFSRGAISLYVQRLIEAGNFAQVYDDATRMGIGSSDLNLLTNSDAGTRTLAWARDNNLPIFHSGTAYVPKTGLALMEEGERVLSNVDNARMVRAVSSQGEAAQEVRMLRQQIAAMAEQQAADAGTIAALTARMHKIMAKWDDDGLLIRGENDQPVYTTAAS